MFFSIVFLVYRMASTACRIYAVLAEDMSEGHSVRQGACKRQVEEKFE